MQSLLEVKVRSEIAYRQRNRTLMVWTCKILLAAAMVGGAVYGGREIVNRMFLKNPDYNLAAVEITDDGAALSRELILSTAGFKVGQNIFTVSLAKAREAVATLPQVDRVDLARSLPNKITVEIVERRPVAWLAEAHTTDPSTSEKSFLIDSKGVLFKPKRQLPEYLRLPAIYGAPVENYLPGETVSSIEVCAALELVQKNSDANRFRLQSIDLSKGYCLIATDARRGKLTFGIDDIGRQLERLGAVLDYVAAQGKEIRAVNLMVERNIPAILVDPAAPEAEPAVSEEPALKPVVKPAISAADNVAVKASGTKGVQTGDHATAKVDRAVAIVEKAKVEKAKSLKKKTPVTSRIVKRAEPARAAVAVVRSAPPVVKRAEPIAQQSEPHRSLFGLRF